MPRRNNPYLWVLDLSSGFNASRISRDFKLSSIPQLTGYKKSIDIPWVSNGIMWADRSGTVYEAGGYIDDFYISFNPDVPAQIPMSRRRAVWSFNPTTAEWGLVQTNGDDIDRVSHTAYASAPNLDLHFAIGGATSRMHQAENINYPDYWQGTINNGMTIFNSNSLSLRNRTLDDLARETNTMPARKEGWCKHIPAGAKGLLVCHSGSTGPPNGEVIWSFESSPGNEYTLNWTNYQTVDLYDIDKDKWYSQSASTESTYPSQALNGCAAIGSDGKTWEIYMHGSNFSTPNDQNEYANQQDIWVLTIPAFRWFRITTDRNRRPLTGHGCHIVGKQLITVSGYEIEEVGGTNKSSEGIYCTNSPFRVYDLELLKWADNFVPSNYAPPKVVADYVKDPGHDRPLFGWANPEIEALFNQPPSPTSVKTSSKDRRGAIAGGVVGGVVAIIAGVVLFLYFKRRGRGASTYTPDGVGVGLGTELPVGMEAPDYVEKYQPDAPTYPIYTGRMS